MLIFPEKIKIHKTNNGHGGKGFNRAIIQMPSRVMDQMGWSPQEVLVIVIKPNEPVDVESLKQRINIGQKQMEQDIELERVKGWKKQLF